jgi:cell fate regulator YaaT (PSP1 superfamily)
MIKGIAVCGRMVCCAGILQNMERVTVKMAKEQSMSLNPEKISGLCGRLMCCLAYEHDAYACAKKCAKDAKTNCNKAQENPLAILPDDKNDADLAKMEDDNDFDASRN